MAAEPRSTRALETRTSQRRWKPASTLPDPIPQAGWGYRWVMSHLLGEAQPTNLSQRLREGYEPVKVADHPELAAEANDKGEIRIGGLVLCRMPAEMLEDRKAFYEAQANSQAAAINNKYLSQADPRMPVFSENKSGTSRGSFGNGNV